MVGPTPELEVRPLPCGGTAPPGVSVLRRGLHGGGGGQASEAVKRAAYEYFFTED